MSIPIEDELNCLRRSRLEYAWKALQELSAREAKRLEKEHGIPEFISLKVFANADAKMKDILEKKVLEG